MRARRGRGNASRQVSKDLCLAPSNLGRNRVWLVRDILVSPLSVKSLSSARTIEEKLKRRPPRPTPLRDGPPALVNSLYLGRRPCQTRLSRARSPILLASA